MKNFIVNNKLNILLILLMTGFAIFWFGRKPNYVNGEKAPDFTSQNLQGENLSLSDYDGYLILLDFWGSWCGPCRSANANLVHLHDKYGKAEFKKAKGFIIYSVGIETKEANWKQAIKQDGMNWDTHVSDFKRFRSPAAKLYGVFEIPTAFLINEKGIIIGVDLPYNELEDAIIKRLK